MNWFITSLTLLFAISSLGADNPGDRSKLIGTWQLDDPSAKEAAMWTIENTAGDLLRITYSGPDQKADQVECNALGRECETGSGKKVKVSMWYTGRNWWNSRPGAPLS